MALHSFWRRHRWAALRSLLLVALLHRLHFLAFLAASSPVWLLTAFLLGAVLVHSEPNNVPLAAVEEERHLYKKIRPRPRTGASGSSSDESEEQDVEDHLVVDNDKDKEVLKAAVAWTADDEHSIQSIGSLELERDARLEKLMSSRTTQRNLVDLDVHIPAENHHPPSSSYYGHGDDHGAAAAPSVSVQRTNPLDIDIDIGQQQRERDSSPDRDPDPDPDEEGTEIEAAMLRRHESSPLARPSRFEPYFGGGGGGVSRDAGSDNSSSSAASDHQTQQEAAQVRVEEAPAASTSPSCAFGNGMVLAVDVELISDSSDDDMSLQGGDATAGPGLNNARHQSDDDEEDSFEVESITQQVAAAGTQPPRVTAVVEPVVVSPPSEQGQEHRHQQQQHEDASIVNESPLAMASLQENQQRERDLTVTEMREHHILGAVPLIGTSAGAPVGAAGAVVAAAPTPPAAAAARPPQPAAAPTPPAAAAAGPPPVGVAASPQSAAAAPTPPAAAAGPPPQPAAAPTPRATAAAASAPPSGKLSSKSKVASKKIDPKKAVFGFFRK